MAEFPRLGNVLLGRNDRLTYRVISISLSVTEISTAKLLQAWEMRLNAETVS